MKLIQGEVVTYQDLPLVLKIIFYFKQFQGGYVEDDMSRRDDESSWKSVELRKRGDSKSRAMSVETGSVDGAAPSSFTASCKGTEPPLDNVIRIGNSDDSTSMLGKKSINLSKSKQYNRSAAGWHNEFGESTLKKETRLEYREGSDKSRYESDTANAMLCAH
jgi:hypothetical protein